MTQAISDEAIARATGRSWQEWLRDFETMGASSLPHKEIARRLSEEYGAPGWWAQMLTVQYEQQIGRRQPGQDCDGEYGVSVSKTLPGSMNDAMAWWRNAVDGRDAFDDVPMTRGPDESATEKWRYWRCGLADGSRVNVNCYEKAAGKVSLTIQHERLETADDVGAWRAYWRRFLAEATESATQST